mmetsp:Transcript_6912/g.12705  ORF Transcript_6912/g.12705 Transcript_6912/m.12705 type:complete len:256 (-) Transcript_6912:339-1106(-)
MAAMFEEVSTRSPITGDIRMTPWGRLVSRQSRARVEVAVRASLGMLESGESSSLRPVSTLPNSRENCLDFSAQSSRSFVSESERTQIVAVHSLAIAFLLLPPLISTTKTFSAPNKLTASIITTAAKRTAFDLPEAMSMPLWPPFSPLILSEKASKSPCSPVSVSCVAGTVMTESPPPAHPTYTLPHSSVSKLSMVFAESISPFNCFAPVRPVSSSTVKRHSRGGSFADLGICNRARAAATPIPLSAPKVVPLAVI